MNSKEYELSSVKNFDRKENQFVKDVSKLTVFGQHEDSTTIVLKNKGEIKLEFTYFVSSKATVEVLKQEPRSITVQANVAKKSKPDNIYIVLKLGYIQYPFTNFTKEDDEYTFNLNPDTNYHRFGEYEVHVVVND